MPVSEMPSSTATIGLIRSLGGTMGISASSTIFASLLRRSLASVEGYTVPSGDITANVAGLSTIEPVELRQQVLHAYTRSLQSIWYVGAPLSFVGFLLCCFLKHYSLDQREVVRTAAPVKAGDKAEGEAGGESTRIEAEVVDGEEVKVVDGQEAKATTA